MGPTCIENIHNKNGNDEFTFWQLLFSLILCFQNKCQKYHPWIIVYLRYCCNNELVIFSSNLGEKKIFLNRIISFEETQSHTYESHLKTLNSIYYNKKYDKWFITIGDPIHEREFMETNQILSQLIKSYEVSFSIIL